MPAKYAYLVPLQIPDDAIQVIPAYAGGGEVYTLDPVRLAGSSDETVRAAHEILMRSPQYAAAWRMGVKFVMDPHRVVSGDA